MNVSPYNLTSYLVESESREEMEHIVDVETLECSCEAALDFKTRDERNPCKHLTAALAHHAGKANHKPTGGSPLLLLQCKQHP